MAFEQKEVSMTRKRTFAFAAFALLALSWTSAQAGVFVGFGFGGPVHRPYYHPYWYGPRVVVGLPPVYIGTAPAPVYVAPPPAPVYVTPVSPAPVYVQPAPTQPAAAPPAQAPQSPGTLPPAPIPVGRN
jgi:hypothetical protein